MVIKLIIDIIILSILTADVLYQMIRDRERKTTYKHIVFNSIVDIIMILAVGIGIGYHIWG